MFPLMAQGHIIPFLALALHLENTNRYTITFVNTPSNLKKLKSSLPQNSSIHLREIPFDGIAHDLPPCTENTDSLPFHLFPNFFESTLSFKPHFRKLINGLFDEQNGHKPVCIIADMFFAWSAEIAQEYGIFNALFVGGGSFGFACFYSLWLNLPHRDSDEFLLPDFPEASRIHVTQMTKFLRLADGKEYGISTESCKNWLDTKPCNSVIYVSFGSQNTIAASQMMQLAMALEACGKNFIWVVKPPLGFDLNSEFRANEWLPEGFEERIKDSGQGLVVQKWAPQVEILSHKSISAFLSHCGWNSVLEALSHGVPIIGWPLAAEQFYNSKLLEEVIGVCVEVARGMNCEVSKENLSAKFELVMNETEKGMDLRKKASEVEMIIKNAVRNEEKFKGSSVKAMEQFLDAALMMKKAQKEED
ncbi:hypothetical protein WN943_009565 [Citrus x changshan-huyou]